ncbi:FxsA family protein [Oligoflexus tunisiensis]|uniref:FxsA family protein n=1 Tax=Oligoflexus tunisiensis TaxID=708132 RepID=UPI000A58EA48|nr:FxsA family protein [Oligoflexus tunisiensis]
MLGRLFLLFMIMPFLELFVIVQVHGAWSARWGGQSAWLWTLGMIFLTAIFGVSVARSQGFRLYTQAQQQLRSGQVPSQTMLEGLLMLGGATALIIPGYITDVLGLLLLIPWTRTLFVKALKSWMGKQVGSGHIIVHQSGFYSQPGTLIRESDGVDIIDVEPIQKS